MQKLWPTFLLLLSISGVVFYQKYSPPTLGIEEENESENFNEGIASFSANTVRVLSLGYERATSALIWLRFLQHTPPKKIPPNKVSWIFQDLNTISYLDPEFVSVFTFGAIFLSVITEDKLGAEQLLLRGVKLHPDNWQIKSNLAYHYYFELNKPDLALKQYEEITKIPNVNPIYGMMAASILKQSGSNERAISILTNLKKSSNNSEFTKKIDQKILNLNKGKIHDSNN